MKKNFIVLLIAFFIFAIFFAAGTHIDRELQNTDEGIYLTVASEAVENNTWFRTTYHNNPYFNKLAFAIWPYKAALMLFNFNDISYRAVQLFIGFLCVVAIYFTAKKFTKNTIIALLSAMLLLTFHQFYVFLIDAKMDTLLLFFQILSLLFLFCWYEKYKKDQANLLFPLLFAISLALAFLTKTVMAALVPIIFFLFLVFTKNLKFIISQKKQIGLSVIIFFAIVITFFAFYLTKENYNAVFNSLFLTEIKNRALTGYHNQKQSLYYFNLVLGGRFIFPLLILFPTLLYMFYLGIKKKQIQIVYLIIWAITPILVMSLAKSRLTWYVILSFPAFAMMTAIFVYDVLNTFFKKSMYLMAVPSALVCIFLYNQVAGTLNMNTTTNNHVIKQFVYEMKKDENKGKKICIYDEYKPKLSKRKREFEKFYYSQIKTNIVEIEKDDVEKMVNERTCDYYILPYNTFSSLILKKAASLLIIPKVKNTRKDLIIMSLEKNDKFLPSLDAENEVFKAISNGKEVDLPFVLEGNQTLDIVGTDSCVLEATFLGKKMQRYGEIFINNVLYKTDFFKKSRLKSSIPYRSLFFLNKKEDALHISTPYNMHEKVRIDLKCNSREYIDPLFETHKVLLKVSAKKRFLLKKYFVNINGRRFL